ncbi:MAG: hypothetical protein ABIH00_03140 [Armatimonadota bacterium]
MDNVINGIKVIKTVDGIPKGVVNDTVMGKVPVVYRYNPISKSSEWLTDTAEIEVSVESAVKTLLHQVRVLVGQKGYGSIEHRIFIIEAETLKNFAGVPNDGKCRIDINFTTKNMLKIKSSMERNPALKEQFIDLISDIYMDARSCNAPKEENITALKKLLYRAGFRYTKSSSSKLGRLRKNIYKGEAGRRTKTRKPKLPPGARAKVRTPKQSPRGRMKRFEVKAPRWMRIFNKI